MTASREPGWYPDEQAPATLQRYHDGSDWTDQSRPAGYVTQPGGPTPVVTPGPDTTPVFGATPPPAPEPGEAQRRMTTATVVVVLIALVAVVLVVLLLTGTL